MKDYKLEKYLNSRMKWYDRGLQLSWLPFVMLFPVLLIRITITGEEPGTDAVVGLIVTCFLAIFCRVILSYRVKKWEDEYYSTYINDKENKF